MPDIRDHGGNYGGRSPNLKPENIKRDVNISGVIGTLDPATAIAGTGFMTSGASSSLVTARDTTFTKYKEIKVPVSGQILVTFSLSMPGSQGFSSGKIYKNGIPVGAERLSGSGSYTVYSELITVSKNDLIQLYLKHTDGIGYAAARDYKVEYGYTAPPAPTVIQ
ncbi:hypothetical protein ASF99_04720 [Exiguobacterium sp. Leaf187]|uniref:hypothetical protein n=1 Tax=Exiguobacterium sp. Leaf187 TaxID=1736294 RepID=UPI000701EE4F|nr:hypothetical protein [Exiguobacterium sp. Leaf187]KQS19192.1 hypothetical protein ASF99_04720 [Exiguobacterium sp. Leaf187]